MSGLMVAPQNIYYFVCYQIFDIGSSCFQIFPGVKGRGLLRKYLADTGCHGKAQIDPGMLPARTSQSPL